MKDGVILPGGVDPSKVMARLNFEKPDLAATARQPDSGWRVWQCSLDARPSGDHYIYSVTHRVDGEYYFWKPREKSQAFCKKCGANVPGENCSCGFYSARTFEHLMSMHYHPYDKDSGTVIVLGRLANAGKVIPGTQGWRSQYAYPSQLWVPYETPELIKPLQRTYGVSVEMRNWLK
jgi:hypothetical protein